MMFYLALAFIFYFVIILTIGFVSHSRSKTETDFVLGDRSVNFWLTALSAHASDMSAWLFMSVPAAMYIGGVEQAWICIGLVFGMYINWQFIATKLRKETEKSDSYTLSSFFEKKFNDSSGALRLLTAVMSTVFLVCYLSAGLIAMGFLFEPLFGINYFVGLSFSTAVIIAYTLFGGFVTVAWVDFFQGLFLLAVIVMVPFFALNAVGGVEEVINAIEIRQISNSLLPGNSWTSLMTVMFLSFGWGLGYLGQPHIITKFMGISNPDDLRKSKYIGMAWQILALAASTSVGLIGIAFFLQGIPNPELIFVEIVRILFHPFCAGIILCALIAANLSTMDSQILVCASVITEDMYKLFAKGSPSSSRLLKVSRMGVVLVTLLSLIIASTKNATVMDTVFFAWAGLGCTFGPLVLMSLYSKRVNRYGAFAGILTGGGTAIIWPFLGFDVPTLVIGFPLGCLSIYIISRLTASK